MGPRVEPVDDGWRGWLGVVRGRSAARFLAPHLPAQSPTPRCVVIRGLDPRTHLPIPSPIYEAPSGQGHEGASIRSHRHPSGTTRLPRYRVQTMTTLRNVIDAKGTPGRPYRHSRRRRGEAPPILLVLRRHGLNQSTSCHSLTRNRRP